MTESEIRAKVVAQARAWLGRNEADGTYKEIIDIYNSIRPLPVGYTVKYTDAWCAATVSAIGQACGITDVILPECSCFRMISLYQAAGRWMEDDAYVPHPGDLIMNGWEDSGKGDYTGVPDHVGMVENCDGKNITVIEGNYSDSVKRRTIAVNARYIRGYCLPDYAGKAAQGPEPIFSDIPVGAWYEDDVRWCVERGIFAGYEDGTFHPEAALTRAQAAALIRRTAQHFGA